MRKEIPISFEATPQSNFEQISPLVSKGRVRIFYKYENRNGGFISDEFAEHLISNLPYVPIVGIYDEKKGDFLSHDRDRDKAQIYGLVPPNFNGRWETSTDKDGYERTYYTCDVYLYTGRLSKAVKINDHPQSFELDRDSIEGDWFFSKDGREYFKYTNAHFIGLSVLGKDVEPCFQGAAFYDFLTSFEEYFSNLFIRDNKGGKVMDNEVKEQDLSAAELTGAPKPVTAEEVTEATQEVVEEVPTQEEQLVEEASKEEKKEEPAADEKCGDKDKKKPSTHALDLNEEEYKAYNSLIDTYSSLGEVVGALEKFSLENKKNAAKIVELNEKYTTYGKEASNKISSLSNELDTLRANLDAASAQILETEKAKKEAILDEYKTLVSDFAWEQIKGKMDSYSLEDLEKELLFEMKKEKPSIFSANKKVAYSPSSFVQKEENGLVAILSEYYKKN